MELQRRISRIEPHLLRLGRAREFDDPSVRRRAARNDLVRVHYAHYLRKHIWDSLEPNDRHLARIMAVHAVATRPPLFSHISAAVLHGLPLYGMDATTVHVTTRGGGTNRRSHGLMRHRSNVPETEVTVIQGLRFTSINRTIADVSKDCSVEAALVCADGYLRKTFRVQQLIDEQGLGEWREEMHAALNERKGAYGSRKLQQVVRLADPRTDSVLESLSHLRLRQLGFQVALQVPVPGPNGYPFYVDFEFLGLNLFGECDGKSKYTDASQLGALTSAEVVYREKRRHDWITGRENKRMIRWGYADVQTVETFSRRLRAFNVPLPGESMR